MKKILVLILCLFGRLLEPSNMYSLSPCQPPKPFLLVIFLLMLLPFLLPLPVSCDPQVCYHSRNYLHEVVVTLCLKPWDDAKKNPHQESLLNESIIQDFCGDCEYMC